MYEGVMTMVRILGGEIGQVSIDIGRYGQWQKVYPYDDILLVILLIIHLYYISK